MAVEFIVMLSSLRMPKAKTPEDGEGSQDAQLRLEPAGIQHSLGSLNYYLRKASRGATVLRGLFE
jgi:hypothetical protein